MKRGLRKTSLLSPSTLHLVLGIVFCLISLSSEASRPSNDKFTNRILLKGTLVSLTNTLVGATTEAREPEIHTGANGSTVWYSWKCPIDGWTRFSVSGSTYIGVVDVFAGERLGDLKLLGSSDSHGYSSSWLELPTKAGRVYQVRVDGIATEQFGYVFGPFALTINHTTLHMVSPTDGAILDTSAGVSFILSTPVQKVDGALASVIYELEDPSGGYFFLGEGQPPSFNVSTSYLPIGTFTLRPLAKKTDGTVKFVRPVTFTLRPPNDDFIHANIQEGYRWQIGASTAAASAEAGEPWHDGTPPTASVWFEWTAPASGHVTASVSNLAPENGKCGIYTGDTLRNLRPVGLSFRTNYSDVFFFAFDAHEGTKYYFAIDKPGVISPVYHWEDFFLTCSLNTVNLTAPSDGDVYKAPKIIPLSIATTENPQEIAAVNYYAVAWSDGYYAPQHLVFSSASYPYSGFWTNATPDVWSISAELIKTNGQSVITGVAVVNLRPFNDDFEDRQVVVGTNVSVSGYFSGSSLQPGEPFGDVGPSSVWYSWTAPADGMVSIAQQYGFATELMAVFLGNTLESLQRITDDYRSFHVTNGMTLQIAIGSDAWDKMAHLTLSLDTAPPVQPRSLILADLRILPDGRLCFSVVGEPGQVASVEWSEDLANWYELNTIDLSLTTTICDALVTTNRGRFYRTRLIPR